jgi:integrase
MTVKKIKTKSGVTKWEVRGRVGGRGSTELRRRFLRKDDAERWATEQMRSKQLGGVVVASRKTLDEYGGEWWERAERELAATTARNYEGVLRRHVLPRLSHVRLSSLNPPVVARFQADLRSAEVGVSTVRLAMAVLSAICRDAVERGEMQTNPVSEVKKVSAPRQHSVDCLPPSKVEALRDQMPSGLNALLISVLAYAGVRPGEAIALTWGDVGERTIRVNKALSLGEEKETKTRRDRTVRLLGPLAEDLRAARVALGRIPDASERIFRRSSDGGDWTESVYRNWRRKTFKPAAEKAGLPKSTRPYDLRHSFCSLLIAEGASVVEVAAQAGHSPTMTLNTYGYVMDELAGAERKDAEAVIREARASQVRQRQADAGENAQETAKVGAAPT